MLNTYLELPSQFYINPAGGEVVGYRILHVVHIRYPVIRDSIVYIGQVEDLDTQPQVFHIAVELLLICISPAQ